jgi:hypothetical protein
MRWLIPLVIGFQVSVMGGAACAQAQSTDDALGEKSAVVAVQTIPVDEAMRKGISSPHQVTLIYAFKLDTKRQTKTLPAAWGGLSSILIQKADGDGLEVKALTDQGHLASFRLPNPLTFNSQSSPDSVNVTVQALAAPSGKILEGAREMDSEGLAPHGAGFLVSFERNHRILAITRDPATQRLTSQNGPNLVGFEGLEPNGGMEALVALPDGRYLASAEYGRDKPQDKLLAPYWIFGPEAPGGIAPFGAFTNQENFGITDARVLGGDLWLLKRAYDPKTKINRSRLERCPLTDVLQAKPICTLELALSPPFPMDNYEGLEMLQDPKSGDWIAILLSDDNFSDDQSTNLLAFRLAPSPAATPK